MYTSQYSVCEATIVAAQNVDPEKIKRLTDLNGRL